MSGSRIKQQGAGYLQYNHAPALSPAAGAPYQKPFLQPASENGTKTGPGRRVLGDAVPVYCSVWLTREDVAATAAVTWEGNQKTPGSVGLRCSPTDEPGKAKQMGIERVRLCRIRYSRTSPTR